MDGRARRFYRGRMPLHAASLLLALVPFSVQEAPPPAAPGPAAAQPASTSADEARAALAAAMRHQRGDLPRAAPSTLHGRFSVTARDDAGSQFKVDIERWYARAPERMLTRRREVVTGAATTQGWTDGAAWMRDDASGKVFDYSSQPETFETDLELLREQLRLTRLLLDAIVLDALVPRLASPRLVGRDRLTDPDGAGHELLLVEATAPDAVFGPAPDAPPPLPGDPEPQLQLRLGIDAADGALWTLAVRAPHRPDLAPLELVFAFHGSTRSGLRVPGNIKVFRAGEAQEMLALAVAEDDDGHLALDVDLPLEAGLFARPAPP